MEELKIFNSPEFGEVRTVTVDHEPWFVGIDVAKALGYKNPSEAVSDNCKHSAKRQHSDQLGRLVEMTFIPEGDLYRLTARSKLPSAEKFEEWIFDEVLPSLRKTGQYTMPELRALENKAQLFDRLTGGYENKNFRESAKALGITQSQFIGWLKDNKMIQKTEFGETLPTPEYENTGFFKVQCYRSPRSFYSSVRTLVTPTGLTAFAAMLDAAGLTKDNMKKHGGRRGGNPEW